MERIMRDRTSESRAVAARPRWKRRPPAFVRAGLARPRRPKAGHVATRAGFARWGRASPARTKASPSAPHPGSPGRNMLDRVAAADAELRMAVVLPDLLQDAPAALALGARRRGEAGDDALDLGQHEGIDPSGI